MQLHQAGDLARAEAMYREVLAVEPGQADAWHLLGAIFWQRGDLEEGEKLIRHATKIWGKSPDYFADLGGVLKQKGLLPEAVREYKTALKLDPGHKNARVGIMKCYSHQGYKLASEYHWDEAEANYLALLALNPGDPAVLNNLAEMYQHSGNREKALEFYSRALEAKPDYAIIRYNRAICRLGLNDLPGGWEDLAASIQDWLPRMHKRPLIPWLHVPLWDGSSLKGKKILIWGDQGIGDEVLFASMIPELQAQGADITIECNGRFLDLFTRSFPGIKAVERKEWPFFPIDFDFHAPGLWLPRWLRPDFNSFPAHRGYLKADRQKTEMLRARYCALAEKSGKKRVVGVSWFSKTEGWGEDRRITLREMAEALPKDDALYIDLQYGDRQAEIAEVCAALPDFAFHHDPEIDQMKDMDAFAAQICACDAVATIGNTTAHMAGALGVPGAVLLPVEGLTWYWFEKRPDSPWYPGLKMLRKERENGWKKALAALPGALTQL